MRSGLKALGFSLCGVVPLERFPEHAAFDEWLRRGYGGAMGYLADPKRREPEQVLEGARSVIVCALNYNTDHPYSNEAAASDGSGEARGGFRAMRGGAIITKFCGNG